MMVAEARYTVTSPAGCGNISHKGGVLKFKAETMPIFPEGRNAYAKESGWGTLIKLFEYTATGYSNTHILRKDGLLGGIDFFYMEPASRSDSTSVEHNMAVMKAVTKRRSPDWRFVSKMTRARTLRTIFLPPAVQCERRADWLRRFDAY